MLSRTRTIIFEYWWALPLISAMATAAIFLRAPFSPLGVIFLYGPLFFLALSGIFSPKKLFVVTFMFLASTAAVITVATLSGFKWIPNAYLFTNIVHSSWPLLSLIVGFSAAVVMYIYALIITPSNGLNILTVASATTLLEWALNYIFHGYNFGIAAITLSNVNSAIGLVSIGGMHIVSFVFYALTATLASFFLHTLNVVPAHFDTARTPWWFLRTRGHIILIVLLLSALFFPFSPPQGQAKSVSVVVVQSQERGNGAYGTVDARGRFSFPLLEKSLESIYATAPDIIIYPFSPVAGVFGEPNSLVKDGTVVGTYNALGSWLATRVLEKTHFVTWNSSLIDDKFYNEFTYWEKGKLVGRYVKRNLFPFLDFTPSFSAQAGLYTTPFDVVENTDATGIVTIGAYSLGNLVCSEIAVSSLARADAPRSDFILSLGSEAMFSSPNFADFDMRSAVLRAVETGRPVVRANKLGPSAVIEASGRISSFLARGESGILTGTVIIPTVTSGATPYAKTGDIPILAGSFAVIFTAVLISWNTRRKLALGR